MLTLFHELFKKMALLDSEKILGCLRKPRNNSLNSLNSTYNEEEDMQILETGNLEALMIVPSCL